MKSQVTLLLICTLFSKARALNCHQCVPSLSGTCEEHTQTSCSDQCLTSTTSTLMGAIRSDISMKACGVPESCVSGSMNLGMMKILHNAKCCKTDLCNSETMPALPRQAPNGRKCYTCDANSCSGTVSCEGTEDRCITTTVQQGGNTISMKGCVSKSFCTRSGSQTTPVGISNVHCCEGNLCNAAESFTLSFLLMIVPLLSSILFY